MGRTREGADHLVRVFLSH